MKQRISIAIAFIAGALFALLVSNRWPVGKAQSNSSSDKPYTAIAPTEENALTGNISDFRASVLARQFPSVLIINQASGKFVDRLAVRQNIYDLSFVVYRSEFATANGFPKDTYFIDDSLPVDVKAIEISVTTKRFKTVCELKILLNESADVGVPNGAWTIDLLSRGDSISFPVRTGEESPANRKHRVNTERVGLPLDYYISAGPFASVKDKGSPGFSSIHPVEYSDTYFLKTKFFRFNLGCEGSVTRHIEEALSSGDAPVLTLRRTASADQTSPSVRFPTRSYLSVPLPTKLLKRALPWLKTVMIQLPVTVRIPSDLHDSYPRNLRNSLPPEKFLDRVNVE